MKLLLTFTYNVSLDLWYKSGVLSREISLYKKLSEKNVEILFLTFGTEKDLSCPVLDGVIKIIPINNLIKAKNPILKFLKSLLLPLKLKKIFKDIDIIKTNQIEGSWIGCIGKILYRKKFIVRGGYEWLRTYTTIQYFRGKRNFFKYLYNYFRIYITEYIVYKLADKIILTSETDINFVIKKFKFNKKRDKIYEIQNFIDINLFKPLNLKEKPYHVLYIGKLHLTKNVLNLVSAFKDLKNFTLDIIGEGPYKIKLEEIIKQNNLHVNFLGIFPNDKLPEIINKYPIFILPSLFEGNPKSLLEAMSCGAACIGTNVGGIKNIIKHKENGYLCKTDSISIRNAIIALYNDKKLRKKIGQEAREFIVNNCSLESIANKEFLLYKSLFI